MVRVTFKSRSRPSHILAQSSHQCLFAFSHFPIDHLTLARAPKTPRPIAVPGSIPIFITEESAWNRAFSVPLLKPAPDSQPNQPSQPKLALAATPVPNPRAARWPLECNCVVGKASSCALRLCRGSTRVPGESM